MSYAGGPSLESADKGSKLEPTSNELELEKGRKEIRS